MCLWFDVDEKLTIQVQTLEYGVLLGKNLFTRPFFGWNSEPFLPSHWLRLVQLPVPDFEDLRRARGDVYLNL